MDWMCPPIPKFMYWSLTLHLMIFGIGACGWYQVIRVEPSWWISALLAREMRKLASLSALYHVRKDMARKWPSITRKWVFTEPNHVGTLISYLQPSEMWERSVCCLSHLVYGYLVITAQTDKDKAFPLQKSMIFIESVPWSVGDKESRRLRLWRIHVSPSYLVQVLWLWLLALLTNSCL